jgi:hypothetical protein
MARLADQFTSIDADDLLKPVPNPSEIAVKWEDGITTTFRISVTFTETAFHGRRAFFMCPRCQRRSRKLYVNGFYKILACRRCLGLRYRSQERLSKRLRSFLYAMGENPDRLGFRREND